MIVDNDGCPGYVFNMFFHPVDQEVEATIGLTMWFKQQEFRVGHVVKPLVQKDHESWIIWAETILGMVQKLANDRRSGSSCGFSSSDHWADLVV